MKKVYLILIIIILLVFSLNLSLDAQKKKIIDRIVVAIDHNYPPYIFRSEEGFLKGYLVDLWREWEKVTGVQVVLYAVEWSQALKSIEEGKSDVIDTIFYTEERAKIFSYSKPYATINVPIIYSKTISGIADYDSLKGFLIAAKEGDAAVEYLQKNGVTNLILFKDYKDIILSAKDEKIKVFTIDEPCAIYYLNKYNILENYKIGFYLYTGQFHRAVKKVMNLY
ncbi:MAG: transporter substrate-binding domain-containing protein [Exilispira sp.]|jgi:ABC-type amino acid transport substrate-binding protein|nr:transporter substrate-binding domain-containing protein [Exilispira sp.]